MKYFNNSNTRFYWSRIIRHYRFVVGQYVTLHGDVISHVNISNVQVEDGGIYRCTAANRVGQVSHSADMRVYGEYDRRRCHLTGQFSLLPFIYLWTF
jgi:hypothetical protein